MDADGFVNISIKFNDQFAINCKALVVENLSVPIILGLDVIHSLEFNQKSSIVKINDNTLKLVSQNDEHVAYVSETTYLEPYSENIVPVQNKLQNQNSTSIQIMAKPLKKQKNKDDYVISDGIYKTEDQINVIVTNQTHKRIRLTKTIPLCTLQHVEIPKCNALRALTKDESESKEVVEFQRKRLLIAEETNFIPEIASYGDVNDDQARGLKKLVFDNRLAFTMGSSDLGKLANFRFTLPQFDETKTAHQPQRPVPVHLREKVANEIEKWTEMGIIESSQSGYNIPLIILRKGDGSIRISLDARQLNTLLIPDRHPIPHLSTVFTQIGEKLSSGKACFVSTFDWSRGYWQVRVATEDQHKLSFAYNNKHFKATRMLYGTSTAPGCFSRVMQAKFGHHSSFIIYLDDMVVIDSSYEEHVKSLTFLFKECLESGILLSPKKCHLCASSIEFLGNRFDKDGMKPLDKHTLSIKSFPTPTDKPSLKRFIGMINFNLKYIQNGSVTMSALYKACSSKRDFVWESEQEEAFQAIKQDLLSNKGLKHRNPSLKLILVNDASKFAVGSTLYQVNGDNLEVIGYSSRRLNGPEERRPMRAKELLALTYGIKAFAYHLIGTRFTVVSDHKSLIYLYREHLRTELDIKLTNVFYYLLNFDFEILHRPGNSDIMASADCLSRLPKSTFIEMEKEIQMEDIPDRVFTMAHLPEQHETQTDKPMKIFLRALAHGTETPTESPTEPEVTILQFEEYTISRSEMIKRQSQCTNIQNITKKLKLNAKSTTGKFKLLNDVVYKKDKNKLRIALPDCISKEFIQYTHIAYGHCGTYQLMKILSKFVYVFQLQSKTNQICTRCVECIRHKTQKMPRPSLIEKRNFEHVPFHKTSIDLYDLGKNDASGKRYLVTCADHLTGFCDGVAISNKTDRLVSQAILDLILRHGITNTVITDCGREFGQLTQQIMTKFRITHVTTAAYMSRSNGRVERVHREITSKLKLLEASRRNWSQKWPFIKFLLNNLPKTSLDGLSASEALYGRALFCPFETIETIQTDEHAPFIKALNEYLTELHPSLMQFQYEKYEKLLSNDKGNAPILKIGTKCLVWKPCITDGKLSRSWSGPFIITRRLSKHTYMLKDPTSKRNYKRNIRHLRQLKSSETETEQKTDAESNQKTTTNQEIANQNEQPERDNLKENEFQNKFNFDALPQFDQAIFD